MWAKRIHQEMAGQPRNQRRPYKLVDNHVKKLRFVLLGIEYQ